MLWPGEILEFVPAVKSVAIENFGVFKTATVDFSPGVNVIAGANGTGKTTIARAIIATISNALPPEYVRLGSDTPAKVHVEFASGTITAYAQTEVVKKELPVKEEEVLSSSEKIYERIIAVTKANVPRQGYCLMLNDVLESLDETRYRKALAHICSLECQKIIVTNREFPFRNIRLHTCIYDGRNDSVRIETEDI